MSNEQAVLNAQWNAAVLEQQAERARENYDAVAGEQMRPSVLFRPSLSLDGDKWCALYGDNLQIGVSGFGSSPDEATSHDEESLNLHAMIRQAQIRAVPQKSHSNKKAA